MQIDPEENSKRCRGKYHPGVPCTLPREILAEGFDRRNNMNIIGNAMLRMRGSKAHNKKECNRMRLYAARGDANGEGNPGVKS